MKTRSLLFSLLALLSSCSLYQKQFDCPPKQGVTCTSVTTLEKMIVEAPSGEDVFLGCVPKLVEMHNNKACKCTENRISDAPFQRRVWIASKEGKPTYIYFEEEIVCEAP